MMKDADFSLLLQKADELRALFVFGQRVIPFLEEIFIFVKDIKPILDEINTNIEENLKKMPGASKQLSKVTEATELATTEIMDIIDGLVYKSDIISENLKSISESENKIQEIFNEFSKILKNIELSDSDKIHILSEKMMLLNNKKNNENMKKSFELLESVKYDSNSIMMALQVQDITSQQIAAVDHMLQAVQEKLTSILEKFQSTDINSLVDNKNAYTPKINVSNLHRKIAFDPDAIDSITFKETRQSEIDKLIDNQELYINNSNELEKESVNFIKNINKQPESETEKSGPISQNDIDALFGKG